MYPSTPKTLGLYCLSEPVSVLQHLMVNVSLMKAQGTESFWECSIHQKQNEEAEWGKHFELRQLLLCDLVIAINW